jgi:hypothetical protein
LIKKLKEKREAEQAAMELFKIGPPAVPPLNDFVREERGCRPRVLAAQLLIELAPESEAIVSSMLDEESV